MQPHSTKPRGARVECVCLTCGGTFTATPSNIARGNGKFCSRAHVRQKPEDRFWKKVNKNGPIPPHRPDLGPCWVWTASLAGQGYGQMPRGPKGAGCEGAHRFSYELHYGPIPEGLEVCHHCDNKPCIRPTHLFVDDQSGNIQDMLAKGRGPTGDRSPRRKHPESYASGEAHHNSKLTAEKVMKMRQRHEAGESVCALSREFGVSESTARTAIHRLAWKHVP